VEVLRYMRRNLYSQGHPSLRAIAEGCIALVVEISPGLWKIQSIAESPIGSDTPTNFLDIFLWIGKYVAMGGSCTVWRV
jgi:hypothetical protein